jgi:hypothetical protein
MVSIRKVVAIPQSLAALLKSSLPISGSNVDPFLHTYKYWKDIESLSKKQKDDALKAILEVFPLKDPRDRIEGELYVFEYNLSQRNTFDIELFKQKVKKRYPEVNLKVLQVLQEESRSPSPFRSYKVKEKI